MTRALIELRRKTLSRMDDFVEDDIIEATVELIPGHRSSESQRRTSVFCLTNTRKGFLMTKSGVGSTKKSTFAFWNIGPVSTEGKLRCSQYQ